jgi:hypothetical protein
MEAAACASFRFPNDGICDRDQIRDRPDGSRQKEDGHSLPSQFSLLLDLGQALLQVLKLRKDLRFHGVL